MRLPFGLQSKITPSCATAIVVSLLPLFYFYPATLGRLIISPDDGVIFNIPMRVVVANLVHAGYVPLWNPYMFSGMPLFGAAQAGVLFPLNWFYLIASIPAATNLMMLSTYVLAALGAYLFARRSGASLAGAVVTSIVWQWSAFMVMKVGQTNVVQTAALLPWVFWAIDGYALSGKRSRGALLAVIVALQIFAGHQQTFAYSFLLAAAYALVLARSSTGRERVRYWSSVVLLVAGVLLGAVQLLPTIELLQHSLRATASYDFFSSFSLPRRFLLTLFAPFLMGGGDGGLFRAPYTGPAFAAEYIAYVGLATIMLAAVSLLLKPDTRTKFWAVAGAICLALAVGRFLPFNIYKLVYYVPVLNLFRVPARHLMEVEFALAVLAGRGLTALSSLQDKVKLKRTVWLASGVVFLLTCLTVIWWRPSDFQLGRQAPVTVLRAPELFMPIVTAGLTALTLVMFVRSYGRRRKLSLVTLLVVLAFDLCLFGHFSGWRLSPTPAHPLWREPESVRMLSRLQREKGNAPYRILTETQPFFVNTGKDEAEKFKLGEFMMSLQPDTYLMYGIENAGGYDGFGLRRYSELAGDMKLWGELTDPERSVRGPGREFDLLNVRYLIRQGPRGEMARRAAERAPLGVAPQASAAPALVTLGGVSFGQGELGAPSLLNGERLVLATPATDANAIGLITSLSWSADVKDGEVVGHIRLRSENGKQFEFQLRAGEHTAEWSRDRPDLKDKILHRRAPVATSFPVTDPAGNYESHTYVAKFSFPETVRVVSGEIEVAKIERAPQLTLDVKRVSLLRDDATEPLRGDWVDKLPARSATDTTDAASLNSIGGGRWQLVAEDDYLQIFENKNALPRAWLVPATRVMSDTEILGVIRSGKFPDGQSWDPLQVALVESPPGLSPSTAAATAEITRHEPNRVEVKTKSDAPQILILSENHYPGWQAFVDEQSVDVMRVNYNLRGVVVPAGEHVVRFAYRPKSVLIGLVISLVASGLLCGWVWNVDRRFGKTRKE